MSIEQEMIKLGWTEDCTTFNRRIFSHPDFVINLAIHNHDDRCFICKWPAIDYNREIKDSGDLLELHSLNEAKVDLWEEFKKSHK